MIPNSLCIRVQCTLCLCRKQLPDIRDFIESAPKNEPIEDLRARTKNVIKLQCWEFRSKVLCKISTEGAETTHEPKSFFSTHMFTQYIL